MRRLKLTLVAILALQAGFASAQPVGPSATDSIFEMPKDKIVTRWYTAENKDAEKGAGGQANFGRKGSPNIFVKPGETAVLADIAGGGTVRRMWFVLFKPYVKGLRGLRLQMFWDGAKEPAVDVPFGDFMGQSHGTMTAFENVFFSSPEGRSFNCFVPMPFKTGARIQVINESDEPNYIFYEIDTTQGEKHSGNMLYFHSHWRRESPTTMRKDFAILPKIEGRGRFLGCNVGVIQNPALKHFWWGEGEYKVYMDGDVEFPTLCGTGTEDFIGAGYGQGKFDHLYQGNPYLSVEGDPRGVDSAGTVFFKDRHGYYRFHVPDPLYFYKDLRVEIQVMGGGRYSDFLKGMDLDPSLKLMQTGQPGVYWTREELEANPDGETTVERIDDHCATAYWYMDAPTNNLPPLAPYEERIKGL